MSTILKIEGLSHKYTSSWAIRDINLEINHTGIFGLLGSNGAGKSTTMNIICGVINQTEGSVFVHGLDMRKDQEQAKKEIGFLPQNPPLYLDLTVDEYLRYAAGLRMIPKEKIRAAVEKVKESCGIAHFSRRLIRNLSGGYRQRVGIAQAIIHRPKLVVLDEPTNGLDPNQLIEVRKLIREIGQEHTVLFSSHVLSEIHLLCNEVVMIEGGQVIFSDTMEAFDNYAQPNSMMVRFGNPPTQQELQNIPGVTKAELLGAKQWRIYFEGNADIAERLTATSLDRQWRLREMTIDKNLLEDIFKQLSTQSIQQG